MQPNNGAPITPALSAEEWARVDDAKIEAALDSELVGWVWRGNTMPRGADRSHAIVALCNAALPDDDPRKITRADVEALEEAATFTDGEAMDDDTDKLRRIAAKLAALLPPEAE